MREFQAFGFEPGYRVEVDPEFPADGNWGCPVFGYDCDGRVAEEFVARWGSSLTVRVTSGGGEWVGRFPASGVGGVDGVFACPAAGQLCVVVAGLAQVVEVGAPGAGAVLVRDQVAQVVPVLGMPLLLLVSWTDLVAIGPDGVAWESARLALDGLRVLEASAEGIRCVDDLAEIVVVDPVTGRTRG
ncbi:hypothetical protein M8C13_40500 [Crossiella sp. SN42]|uniref:hypothetical protein n=1 Tax=Crossiella sp. SN42 TaxID=2944808 RepID=UPI00207D58C9|nr:hypothetical protein [Crossiella sp. SN42]MCO1582049.1 hypothetical protein [Crossiella sp. SN42]